MVTSAKAVLSSPSRRFCAGSRVGGGPTTKTSILFWEAESRMLARFRRLRAVKLVADLQAAVDHGDGERIAGDFGDFDPGHVLVMGDDIEAATDDAVLE